MGYGLKYKAGFVDDTGCEWAFHIYRKDYSGSVSVRPLGAVPTLKCDDGEQVKGTSLEFTLEAIEDGELEEFYTTDNKMFRVEVLRGNTLFWVGFLLPELYSESYIAPPYDVRLSATDGIGILKDVGFDMSAGKFTLAEIIDFCCCKTGLGLAYVYASSLKETRQAGALVYSSISIDTKTFEGSNCYEVLQKLLASTDAYITQFGGEWFVGRYCDLSGALLRYNPATKVVTALPSAPELVMGSAAASEIYPIGELSMEIVPAKKSVKFLTGFGAYPSMLANYDFSKGLEGWEYPTGSENAPPVAVYENEGEHQAVLTPYGKVYQTGKEYPAGYIQQSCRVERTKVSISLSFQAAIAEPRDKIEVVGQKIYLQVHLAGDNGEHHYLTREGWQASEKEVEIGMSLSEFKFLEPSGLWNDNLEEFKIVADGFPATGTVYIKIRNGCSILFTSVGQLRGGAVYLKDVSLAAYVESRVELNVPLCSTASAAGEDIEVPIVDAPVGENIGGAFYNTMWLGDLPTELWVSAGLETSSFLDVVIKSVCSRIGISRRLLSGTISGAFPGYRLVKDKYSNRSFFFQSYEYNLLENEVSGSLIEFIPAGEVDLSNTVIENGRTDGENGRTSGNGDYRVYQVSGGVVLQNVKMVRDLEDVVGLTKNYYVEVDSGFSERSAKASLQQIADVLLGDWFYEKDGQLYCKLDFVGEKEVAAYGNGTGGSGGGGVDLVDNLYSTRNDAALTANMGRYLKTLIDGKASDWDSITGKPTRLSQFANDAGFITKDTNNYLTDVVGSGNGSVTFLRQGMSSLAWNAAHQHVWEDIAGRPTALPANGGNADTVGGYSINDLMYVNNVDSIQAENTNYSHCGFGYEPNGFPTNGAYVSFGGLSNGYCTQIQGNYGGNGELFFRTRNDDRGIWNAWRRLALAEELPNSLPANGGNADTVDGFHAADMNTAGWNSFIGYAYDAVNGVRFYWSKIATIQNGDDHAIIEIYAQTDTNYPSGAHAVIYMSCFNRGESKSVTISTGTTLGGVNMFVRLDASGNVWLKCNAVWASHISVRDIRTRSGIVIHSSPERQLNVPENASNEVEGNGGITLRGGAFSYADSQLLLSGNVICDWHHSRNEGGWFNKTFGGGIHMKDNSWIRTYNGKSFRIEHGTLATGWDGWNVGLALYNPDHTGIEMKGGNHVYGFGAHVDGGMYWWRGVNASLDSKVNKACILHFNGTTFAFTGNITASGEIAAYSASDERLKENVRELDGLRLISSLRPVEFDWNELARTLAGDARSHGYGLIAQEVRKVLPEAVANIYCSDYLGVDYGKLIPFLVAAIRQLNEEIRILKDKM